MNTVPSPSVPDHAAEDAYAARRRDEDELLAQYPGLAAMPDAALIVNLADPLPFEDADVVQAACAILLQRRLDGLARRLG